MALMKSQLATQLSGSIGGTTFGHNKGGMYMRARSIPTQPNSGNQLEVRAAFTELVNAWKSSLTATQRAAWNLYAQNVSVVNRLGDSVNNSGQNWYIAANVPVLQANAKLGLSLPRRDNAPTIFNRGDFTTPVPTPTETSGLSVAFTDTDDWANEDDAALFIYEGAPQDDSVEFFKGPFRLVGAVEGDGTTAPTSPEAITAATLTSLGYTITQNQNVWTAFAVSRADGRLSSRRVVGPDAVGA